VTLGEQRNDICPEVVTRPCVLLAGIAEPDREQVGRRARPVAKQVLALFGGRGLRRR